MPSASSQQPDSPASSGPEQSWWRRLSRHPIFIVLVFVLASKLIGEFYPISPYSMYSNPSTKPLIYCYVADGEGNPIPILWHSGQTPARLTKKQRAEYSNIEQRIEKETGRGEDDFTAEEDAAIRAQAGEKVLQYVIELSHKRSKKRHLNPPLQLVEVAIGLDEDGRLTETPTVVTHLKEEPQPPSDES